MLLAPTSSLDLLLRRGFPNPHLLLPLRHKPHDIAYIIQFCRVHASYCEIKRFTVIPLRFLKSIWRHWAVLHALIDNRDRRGMALG